MRDNHENYEKLLLYSTMPAYEEAWMAGYETAMTDGYLEDNPYQNGDEEFAHWEEGWWRGFYQEQPIFEKNDHKKDNQNQLADDQDDVEIVEQHNDDLDDNDDAHLSLQYIKSKLLKLVARVTNIPRNPLDNLKG